MTQIDTSSTTVIEKSPAQTMLLATFCLIFVLMCIWLLFGDLEGFRNFAGLAPVFGGIGLAFFGFCLIVILRRGLSGPKATITLTPTGITDLRVSPDEIPWSAVENISTWSANKQNIMVVRIPAEAEAKITLTTIAKMTRKANKALGADGLAIAATGLKASHPELLNLTQTYAKAHGAPLI